MVVQVTIYLNSYLHTNNGAQNSTLEVLPPVLFTRNSPRKYRQPLRGVCLREEGVTGKEEIEESRESLFQLFCIPEVRGPFWDARGMGIEGIWD